MLRGNYLKRLTEKKAVRSNQSVKEQILPIPDSDFFNF